MKLLKLHKLLAKESLCRARKRIRNALNQSANECKDALSEIENAHTVQLEGWVSVPIEPDINMMEAPSKEIQGFSGNVARQVYKAMIQAAPTDKE